MPTDKHIFDFDISLNIYRTDGPHQILGSLNPEATNYGWTLDLVAPVDLGSKPIFKNVLDEDDTYKTLDAQSSDRNHLYYPPVGEHSIDSLPYSFWQPGVGYESDVLFTNIQIFPHLTEDQELHHPIVNSGFYTIGSETHYHYSDHSIVQYFDPSTDTTDSGVQYSTLTLSHVPDLGFPISARIYKRNPNGKIIVWRDFQQTTEFLGTLSGNSRATTLQSGSVIWGNVDNAFAYEYILDKAYADGDATYAMTLNQQAGYELLLPSYFSTESLADKLLDCFVDCVGYSGGNACEFYYTTYFPLDYNVQADVKVWTYDANNTVLSNITKQEWTVVTDLASYYFADPNDYIVLLDKDLGRIQFNGYEPSGSVLTTPLLATDIDELELLDASAFPLQGTIQLTVGSAGAIEYIEYRNREGNRLINLIRGADSTAALEWSINQSVEFVRSGLAPTNRHKVCVEYIAIPRVEYEPIRQGDVSVEALHNDRPVTVFDVDVNPIKNNRSEGILYLHHGNTEIASVDIEVLNKPLTGNGAFGPVYIGGDYATIKVTALNSEGLPIPNAELTVQLDDEIGNINGASTITRKTGADGSFVVTYRTPSDPELLGLYSESVTVSGGNTTIVFEQDAEFERLNTDDIYLFQVTKDEPYIGSVGYITSDVGALESSPITSVSNGALIINDMPLEPGYFDGGIAYVEYQGGGIVTRAISHFSRGWSGMTGYFNPPTDLEEATHNMNVRAIHFSTALPAGTIVGCRLVEEDAIEWDATLKNGRKAIVYRLEDQADLTHPSLDVDTVYGPLRPTSISNDTTLVYSGSLPIPDETDNDNMLGAYWSTSPRVISLSVYKSDNLCGAGIILLDTVKLSISLPQSMVGTYISGSLKVPYGFRIVSDTFGAASVLNAATFLTINSVGRFGSEGPFISLPANESLVYDGTESTGIAEISVTITIT